MFRNYIIVILLFIPSLLLGQKVKIAFDTREHRFGQIQEKGGKVSFDFTFTNKGDAPLIIRYVETSCGCTASKWDKRPIPPGGSGTISVSFNPRFRPGHFSKKIVVYTNATPPNHVLKITGEVVEEPSEITREYPFTIGTLRFTTDTILLDPQHIPEQIIGMIQMGKKKITLTPVYKPEFVEISYAPLILQKQQKGDLIIKLRKLKEENKVDSLIVKTSDGEQGKFIIITKHIN